MLPLLSLLVSATLQLSLDSAHAGEVVVEHDLIWMSEAIKCSEKYTWFGSFLSKVYYAAFQRHPL